jgi:hypothetical protein
MQADETDLERHLEALTGVFTSSSSADSSPEKVAYTR